jgi:hypothetical protein
MPQNAQKERKTDTKEAKMLKSCAVLSVSEVGRGNDIVNPNGT